MSILHARIRTIVYPDLTKNPVVVISRLVAWEKEYMESSSQSVDRCFLTSGVIRILAVARDALATMLFCLILAVAAQANAEALPPIPDNEPALIIRGQLENTNVGDEIHLDMDWIKALPSEMFTTDTPWADGKQEFVGVRLSVMFDALGITAKSFSAIGLDGYKADVKVDWAKYPVMIAYKHNGSDISIRRLGPLRIMYPFDEYPELLTDFNVTSAVWQLTHIELS